MLLFSRGEHTASGKYIFSPRSSNRSKYAMLSQISLKAVMVSISLPSKSTFGIA